MNVTISIGKSVTSVSGSMEFASRFIYQGVDVSPVSFKTLATGRQSAAQLWAFFRRVSEFRQVRLSEFFRVEGAGYRVTSYLFPPFSQLYRMPKRWLRLWLVIHHPSSCWGLPWIWWLSAGGRKPCPQEAIGVSHSQLVLDWFDRPSGDGWTVDDGRKDQIPYWEECVKARPLVINASQISEGHGPSFDERRAIGSNSRLYGCRPNRKENMQKLRFVTTKPCVQRLILTIEVTYSTI